MEVLTSIGTDFTNARFSITSVAYTTSAGTKIVVSTVNLCSSSDISSAFEMVISSYGMREQKYIYTFESVQDKNKDTGLAGIIQNAYAYRHTH